ncbi:dihydrolipoamide acetyltransferase family protein [Flavihumibacter stibioxidans]|uniref:Dihydrolipoamide acetyltransferase component of pyruvate dehydrogenase complex n=1 Tax=Flavihumibacter stibioxidans TaxID=1834163 RepID=A0ABR7M666_9BACT|nr:dihydrolipoamide acetyltransferase family protein [Flavihumibacter stibioxidans]MBC6490116.1 branched-chain alpha-keto acid dehydrogenase subunit E2 [Flavihumibacter stibioxidans]
MIEFRMPSLGADMEDGTLVEWLVKPGAAVKRGDIIAQVDTQKGLIDIEIFEEGVVKELLVGEGEKVPVGKTLAVLDSTEHRVGIKASPLAKRMAAEKDIDLALVTGTGEGGAITKEDVEKAAAAVISAKIEKTAQVDEKKEATELLETSSARHNIRQAIASAMSKSNREIPHYYLETKIDLTRSLAWLTETNRERTVKNRLLPVVLLIRAVALALKKVPELNAWYENGLVKKEEINIGFVVSLRGGGVMIPAIRDAGGKSLDELMTALNDMIPRARAMKLRSSELVNTTITITSLGEGQVELVYGVIYPPQVALVGFGAILEQPWAENGMLNVRKTVSVTLAADHRATDGMTGSRFLTELNSLLQTPGSL